MKNFKTLKFCIRNRSVREAKLIRKIKWLHADTPPPMILATPGVAKIIGTPPPGVASVQRKSKLLDGCAALRRRSVVVDKVANEHEQFERQLSRWRGGAQSRVSCHAECPHGYVDEGINWVASVRYSPLWRAAEAARQDAPRTRRGGARQQRRVPQH